MDKKEKYGYIAFCTMLVLIGIVAILTNSDNDYNKFDGKTIAQTTTTTENEMNLTVIDKTRLRFRTGFYSLMPDTYLIKVSSKNPLFDGVTIYVSESEYNKIATGDSYKFKITEATIINYTIKLTGGN